MLVRCYQDLAFRTAYLITQDPSAAEDVAQEAFVKAYYALQRFRSGEPLRPWLLRIVANEARNYRKAQSRRASLALRAPPDRPVSTEPSPEAVALATEQRALLLEAIRELAEGDQLVIASRYFLDLSEAETAVVLGIARGTVKSRLSRALARLRTQLGRTRAEEPASSTGRGGVTHG